MAEERCNIAGVILAGGLARRMGGGDKALIDLGGRPLVAHVIARLSPQTDRIILNANGDPERFAEFDLPVVPDPIEGAAGPLAGVLAGLEWASVNCPACSWIVTVAADTPFFPENLVDRLTASCQERGGDMACATSNGRAHPVFGLWPIALVDDLRKALVEQGIRKVDQWTGQYNCVETDFETDQIDPFFNVNRPEDLDRARMAHAQGPS